MVRRCALAILAIFVCREISAHAQAAGVASPSEPASWSFSAAVYTYLLPDEGNYAQPTVAADHESELHLEARYNYEDLRTSSIWAGYTFDGGESVEWEITPLFGGIIGETSGLAPGYKGSLSWRLLELYSEGEYVFDTGESTDSFFYNWSEVAISPVEWLRAGIVTQRTRAYETDRDIQRGLLIGTTFRKLDLTTYLFNPDDEKPTVVVAVGLSW